MKTASSVLWAKSLLSTTELAGEMSCEAYAPTVCQVNLPLLTTLTSWPKFTDTNGMTKQERGFYWKVSVTIAIVFVQPDEAPVWHWQHTAVSHVTFEHAIWQALLPSQVTTPWEWLWAYILDVPSFLPSLFHESSTAWGTCPFPQMPQLKHATYSHKCKVNNGGYQNFSSVSQPDHRCSLTDMKESLISKQPIIGIICYRDWIETSQPSHSTSCQIWVLRSIQNTCI